MPRRILITGNWKMHGLRSDLGFFEALTPIAAKAGAEVLVCPPASLLAAAAAQCAGTEIRIGGQDCHTGQSGAHTGDVSAMMLRDAGASHVILGHSERRQEHGETSILVCAKAKAARVAGLIPIICVGETLTEREAGRAHEIVGAQLKASLPADAGAGVVIAYEPVWAIGTGLTAAAEDVASMHAFIRSQLREPAATRILYGGSVKPENAAELLALEDVDGALVGGASLQIDSFAAIVVAAKQ
ncbi:triose-phosphate isomerase [uncultured Maricaulis sp.]|uniref:triose-phosphate isomerase n=1 Tax=uncultured Maricaulis sp. TaxID=174710 RepID=UPI0030D7D193|tara:strand:- start:13919 stop:14647 length:729 start_codon:yes stop_codon:yes gene_type:complete